MVKVTFGACLRQGTTQSCISSLNHAPGMPPYIASSTFFGTYAVLVGGLLEDVEPSGDDVDRRAVVLERLGDHEPDACEAQGSGVRADREAVPGRSRRSPLTHLFRPR